MNYLRHFGLREPPFGITPDTTYFFPCRGTQEAFNTLVVAVSNGEGFIKITGEVGTGKTLLCRRFLASASCGTDQTSARYRTAYVPNPCLSPRTLLLAIARELKVRVVNVNSDSEILQTLNRAMLRLADSARRHD